MFWLIFFSFKFVIITFIYFRLISIDYFFFYIITIEFENNEDAAIWLYILVFVLISLFVCFLIVLVFSRIFSKITWLSSVEMNFDWLSRITFCTSINSWIQDSMTLISTSIRCTSFLIVWSNFVVSRNLSIIFSIVRLMLMSLLNCNRSDLSDHLLTFYVLFTLVISKKIESFCVFS